MAGFNDWFWGRTPRQREQQQQALEHPVRTAVVSGVGFGLCMGVFFALTGSVVTGIIGGVVAGLLFGPTTVLITRAMNRRDR